MTDRNAQPHDDAGNADDVHQPDVGVLKNQLREEATRRRHRGHRHRIAGHATLRDTRENRGSLTLQGHRMQHTRGRIQARITGRQNRRQDDCIHDGGRRANPHAREHERERRLGNVVRRVVGRTQQARIRVRQQRADHRDRANVEEHDAPEHRADRTRHVPARVLGLARGHAHQLGALEGEARDHEDRDDADETVVERCIPGRPIRQARRVRSHHTGDHQDTRQDKHNDDDDLDGGQPELSLAIDPRGQRVQPHDDDQEHHRPYPRRHGREPVGHHQARRHEVRGHRHRPVEPVVPPHGEAEGGGNELRGEGLEGARDRLMRTHLAQGLHQEQHHEADCRVGEKSTARTGVRDRRTGGQEQARADRATNGNQLNVARRQAALQRGIGALLHIGGNVVGSGGFHDWVPHLSIVESHLSPTNACVELGRFFSHSLTRSGSAPALDTPFPATASSPLTRLTHTRRLH